MLTKLDLLFCCCLVTKLCSTLLQHRGVSIPGSSVRSHSRILEWVDISFSRDLSNPGIKPSSPASQADTLPLSHQRSQRQNSHFLFKNCNIFSILKILSIIKLLSYTGGKLCRHWNFSTKIIHMKPGGYVSESSQVVFGVRKSVGTIIAL